MAEAVKVAVRVRPFNSREKDMDSKMCITMNGKDTSITNPADSESASIGIYMLRLAVVRLCDTITSVGIMVRF